MNQPQIIQLPKILDDRGNLSFLENRAQIPFDIKRVHWIYDVPSGEERGGTANPTKGYIRPINNTFPCTWSPQ